jgi:glycosyltransferase involved in cell wall biosynthesis
LKILHIAYIYPPTPGVADGITSVVYNVTRELAQRGHEVTVYTSDILDLLKKTSVCKTDLAINGVKVHYLHFCMREKTFIVTPTITSLLSKNLRDFDVVHIHDCRSFQGINAGLLARLNNIPYVYQPHGSYLSSSNEATIKSIARFALDRLVSDKIVRNASKIMVLSQNEAERFKTFGIPADKLTIVPNGLDLLHFCHLPPKGHFKKKFKIPENKKMILYIGRVHKTKGLDLLIKSYAHLVLDLKCDNIFLVIAGPDDGYMTLAKSSLARQGSLNSVLFTGFISERDKISALQDADVFVSPAFYGFPMTFLESCVVGTPIVTTTQCDELDWISGNVGFVTKPTKYAIAEALYSIISDHYLHERFSRNCKEVVRSMFSMDIIVKQIERVYRDAITNKNSLSNRA